MRKRAHTLFTTIACILICVTYAFSSAPLLHAAVSLEDLQNKITEKTAQIDQIEKEIARYEKELEQVGGERKTLESAIAQLNLTRQKLLSDIALTQKKIEQTGYSIEQLVSAIQEQEQKINKNNSVIAHALQTMHESDNESLVEIVLGKNTLTDVWTEFDQLEQIQTTLRSELEELRALKADLSDKKDLEQKEHDSLSAYQKKLTGQKQVVEVNKQQKDQLLNTTKNKEAEYQKLLEEKRLAAQKFESELQDYEAQLQYIRDPSKLPQKGSSVLGWPVENAVITQGFGLTSFAKSGAYGYKDGVPNPHRGVDFKGSVGTPLLAAADGVVRDAVNMDAVKGCYSYGRWILIDHTNGLSTLYAHLSVMSVSAGDTVQKGQIIGYAGASGYATGPHLHFSVFDRDAVQVSPFSWSIGCKGTKVPYAPYDAYLNPLEYLPKT